MKNIIHVPCANEECKGHDIEIVNEINDTDPKEFVSICKNCGDEVRLKITLTVIESSIKKDIEGDK